MTTLTTKQLETDKPVDSIINQLKYLLNSGQLNPGDRLLSERKLAEKFGFGRTHVREAIKKLEHYGILKSIPKSGTFVAGLEVSALEGLISDTLQIESYDLYSLAEARLVLETDIIRLSCRRRTDEDLLKIEKSMLQYEQKILKGVPAVEEDLNFHRQIAEASKNQVLKSMMLTISPDLMTNYRKFWTNSCDTPKRSIAAMEHSILLEYIRNRDEDAAAVMIAQHLRGIMEYAKSQTISNNI